MASPASKRSSPVGSQRARASIKGPRSLGTLAKYGPLLPVVLAPSFPELGARQLSALARRCLFTPARILRDQERMLRGAEPHEILNARALEESRQDGRGVLICSLHHGPFFFIATEVARLGFSVQAFAAQQTRDRWAEGWDDLARKDSRAYVTLPSEGAGSGIRALRGLKAGGAVLVYLDAAGGFRLGGARHQVAVDFLSHPLPIRSGPAILAHQAKVSLIAALAWRDRQGRVVVEFSDPFPEPKSKDPATVERSLRQVLAWFEPRVRKHPEQWMGWYWRPYIWLESGTPPKTTAGELAKTGRHLQGLLDRGQGALRSDRSRIAAAELNGEWLLLDGANRRVLRGTALTGRLLQAAGRGIRLSQLARRFPEAANGLSLELARLLLAGLIRIEGVPDSLEIV